MAYVAFQAYIFSGLEKTEPNAAIRIKLLLNHLQTVGMIGLLELGWTVDFSIYFDYNYILAIDCEVQNIDGNLLVLKIIFTTATAVYPSLIIFIVWFDSSI